MNPSKTKKWEIQFGSEYSFRKATVQGYGIDYTRHHVVVTGYYGETLKAFKAEDVESITLEGQ